MTRRAKVRLRWLRSPAVAASLRTDRLCRPARFDHQGADWTAGAWSLVLSEGETLDEMGAQTATAQFLMPDAPHEWLAPGKGFTIFEGDQALVEGTVERLLL